MTMLKIEHADPHSNAAIAFDVLGPNDAVIGTHVLHFGEHAMVPAGTALRPVSAPELAKRAAKQQAEIDAAHKSANDAQVQNGAPNPMHVDLKGIAPKPDLKADSKPTWREPPPSDPPKQEKPGLAGRKAHEQAKREHAG